MSYNADSIQIKDFRSACNIGKIYKIVDKTNDKIYIGQTINTLEYRFKQHARTPLDTVQINSIDYAIQTKGIDNFIITLIEECKISELDEKEKYWIKYYNSYYNGYNLTFGGQKSRTKCLNDDQIASLIDDYKNGLSIKQICNKYKINKNTLYNYLKSANISLDGNNRPAAIQSSIKNLHRACEKNKIKIYNKTLSIVYNSKKEALIDMINKGYSTASDWHNIRSGLDRAIKNKSLFLGFEWEVYFG